LKFFWGKIWLFLPNSAFCRINFNAPHLAANKQSLTMLSAGMSPSWQLEYLRHLIWSRLCYWAHL
jgi:hypothetical protein